MPWENSRAGQYGPDARKGKHYKTGYCTADKGMLRCVHGKPEHIEAAYPPISEGLTLQTKERRAMPVYVTYPDLIQIGIFIVALASLFYQIFKEKR